MALAVVHDRLAADGPAVEVSIGLPVSFVQRLQAAGQPVPAAVVVRALIDTGADSTCLDPSVLTPFVAVGLPPVRYVFANAPLFGGPRPTPEYAVSLSLPVPSGATRPRLTFGNLAVIEQPLAVAGFQALLGRDVLAACLLVYDGPSGRITLAY